MTPEQEAIIKELEAKVRVMTMVNDILKQATKAKEIGGDAA